MKFWKHLEKQKKRKILNTVSEIVESLENYSLTEPLLEKKENSKD